MGKIDCLRNKIKKNVRNPPRLKSNLEKLHSDSMALFDDLATENDNEQHSQTNRDILITK